MKTRKFAYRSLAGKFVQLMSLFVLVTIISNFGGTSTAFASYPAKARYSGEEVFRGVLLGEGQVADLFPELWQNPQAKRLFEGEKAKEWSLLKDRLVTEIKRSDPAFLEYFGQELQSGDHFRIQLALKFGRDRLQASMQTLNAGTETAEVKPADQVRRDSGVMVVLDTWDQRSLDVDMDVTKTVQVVAIAYVAKIALIVPPDLPTDSSQFSHEQFVDSVAGRLDTSD